MSMGVRSDCNKIIVKLSELFFRSNIFVKTVMGFVFYPSLSLTQKSRRNKDGKGYFLTVEIGYGDVENARKAVVKGDGNIVLPPCGSADEI